MIYWDTSCVVKLYAVEADSDAYLDVASRSQDEFCSSEILLVEMRYALGRKELMGEIRHGAAESLYRRFMDDSSDGMFTLAPIGRDVMESAVDVARVLMKHDHPIHLRTLDGIHVATARVLGADTMLTTDGRVREAAVRLGLKTAVVR